MIFQKTLLKQKSQGLFFNRGLLTEGCQIYKQCNLKLCTFCAPIMFYTTFKTIKLGGVQNNPQSHCLPSQSLKKALRNRLIVLHRSRQRTVIVVAATWNTKSFQMASFSENIKHYYVLKNSQFIPLNTQFDIKNAIWQTFFTIARCCLSAI